MDAERKEAAIMGENSTSSSGGAKQQPMVRIQLQLQSSPDPQRDEEDGTENDGRRHTSCNDDDEAKRTIARGRVNGVVATAGSMEKFDVGDCDGPSTSGPGSEEGRVSGEMPVTVPVVTNGTSSRAGNGPGGIESGDVSSTVAERTPLGEGDDDFDDSGGSAGKKVHPEDENAATSDHDAESGDYVYRTKTGEKPRRWLIDRCDGVSKSPSGFDGSGTDGAEESRPPTRVCWPPIPLKWYPDLLEQNRFCECIGRSGCIDPRNELARKRLLTASLVINAIGLLFLVVASFAITETRYDLLWTFPFTNVWMDLVSGPRSYETPSIFAVGLRAAAHESILNRDANGSADQGILSFGEFCDAHGSHPGTETATAATTDGDGGKRSGKTKTYAPHVQVFVQEYEKVRDCGSCRETSRKIVPSLFLSMLGYIPNFTTDVLRMWSNYDVNCQKFMASVFSWVSLATAIYTWVNYRKECIDYLPDQPIYLDENFHVSTNPGDAFLVVRFNYGAGLGQVCLALASLLKVVDIACNIMLPTPTITRDVYEQVEYEWKYGGDVEG